MNKQITPAERYRNKMRSKGLVKASIWINAGTLKKIDGLKAVVGDRTQVIDSAMAALTEQLQAASRVK